MRNTTYHIFVLLLFLTCRLCAWAATYGILVNGTTYYSGSHVEDNGGYSQYLAHVPFQKGDYFQLCDPFNDAKWAVKLDSYSTDGFTYDATNNRYVSSVTGCYNCYIKLKYK